MYEGDTPALVLPIIVEEGKKQEVVGAAARRHHAALPPGGLPLSPLCSPSSWFGFVRVVRLSEHLCVLCVRL